MIHRPPYETVLKPFGEALVGLAGRRRDIVCLGADLTRQTETDLFRDAFPDRFFNVGMAEANAIGIAGGLARAGHAVFFATFGVFATRRCFDQLAMAIAYPGCRVTIAGFMPGLSSPGGPSHQAIEDVALMRALPNMTVVDVADATETRQAVEAAAERPGPVYLRLGRGEIPVIFGDDHAFSLDRAQVLSRGRELVVIGSGMMLGAALAAAETLRLAGVDVGVLNVPVIKPLDADTILSACDGAQGVITAENHSVIGGLGSAVAEALAEAGAGARLSRVGIEDRFAESGSRPFLFSRYGLSVRRIVAEAWRMLGRTDRPPAVSEIAAAEGTYAPV
ncbi:MAG TPA: transketolase C-terminal domain-containing protein [Solirubrobacteraceae bacterium]|jgi:transketolase